MNHPDTNKNEKQNNKIKLKNVSKYRMLFFCCMNITTTDFSLQDNVMAIKRLRDTHSNKGIHN